MVEDRFKPELLLMNLRYIYIYICVYIYIYIYFFFFLHFKSPCVKSISNRKKVS